MKYPRQSLQGIFNLNLITICEITNLCNSFLNINSSLYFSMPKFSETSLMGWQTLPSEQFARVEKEQPDAEKRRKFDCF